jgi:hypothetical protein
MLVSIALSLIALAGAFLIGLGLASLIRPPWAQRFLLGFATTPQRHYAELLIRIVIGAALVFAAPRMMGSTLVAVAGWVLLITTTVMVALPWRLHRDFAQRAVPKALAYLPVIGVVSLAAGVALVWSAVAAIAA